MVSLANTKELLYQPGNATSSFQAGDIDFSLTQHLDKCNQWIRFVPGCNPYATLIQQPEQLPACAWQPLEARSLVGPNQAPPAARHPWFKRTASARYRQSQQASCDILYRR